MRLLKALAVAPLLVLVSVLAPARAHAWGALGHRTVVETAALLTASSPRLTGWGTFLRNHRFELGLYSMLPDTVFRRIDGHDGKVETFTHFFDLDLALEGTGRSLETLPRSHDEYVKAFATAASRPNPSNESSGENPGGTKEIPLEEKIHSIGQSPWRVEQLMNRVYRDLRDVRAAKGGYQSGADATGDARKIFEGLLDLGVLSHYSGDALVPHHATADWNSYRAGQGGLHFYFETDCVNELVPGIEKDVLALARAKNDSWVRTWTRDGAETRAAGILFQVYADSLKEIPRLLKIDRENAIVKKSDPARDEFAKRKPAQAACRAFRGLVIERLAKGAVLTAYLWGLVLPESTDFTASPPLQFNDFKMNPAYIEPKFEVPEFTIGQRQDTRP